MDQPVELELLLDGVCEPEVAGQGPAGLCLRLPLLGLVSSQEPSGAGPLGGLGDPHAPGERSGPADVEQLRFSADGRWLVAGGGGEARVYEVASRRRVLALTGVWRVAGFDGTGLVVADAQGTSCLDITQLDTRQGAPAAPELVRWRIEGFKALSLSSDGRLAGLLDEAGQRLLQLRAPDGTVLTSADVSLQALAACTARFEGGLEDTPLPGAMGTVAPARNLSAWLPPDGLALSPDGARLGLVAGSTVFLFDPATGQAIKRLSTPRQRDVTSLHLTDRVGVLATMGGTFAVFGSQAGTTVAQVSLGSEVRSVHLADEHALEVAGLRDRHPHALVLDIGALLATARGLRTSKASPQALSYAEGSDVWSVRLSPDGALLALGGAFGKVRPAGLPTVAAAVLCRATHPIEVMQVLHWSLMSGRPELVVELSRGMRQRFGDCLEPDLRGWSCHYELQSLRDLKRWGEAWDVVQAMVPPRCELTPTNEAFRLSLSVEIAYELGRIDEIPRHADACIRMRTLLGDQEGVRLCREMAARYLQQAGRPELAAAYEGSQVLPPASDEGTSSGGRDGALDGGGAAVQSGWRSWFRRLLGG